MRLLFGRAETRGVFDSSSSLFFNQLMGLLAERLKPTLISEMEIRAELDATLGKLLSICKPVKVFVFGSAAEGRATALSDIDICVVFPSVEELKKNKRPILCGFPMGKVPIDWLLVDQETFDRKKDLGGVCFDIQKYGKLIYQGNE